jgi:hypothetical protein
LGLIFLYPKQKTEFDGWDSLIFHLFTATNFIKKARSYRAILIRRLQWPGLFFFRIWLFQNQIEAIQRNASD